MEKSLNIVIIGESSFDSNGFNLAESLTYLGNHVDIIPYTEGLPIYLKNRVTKKVNGYLFKGFKTLAVDHADRLARKIETFEPDLVITLYWSIDPSFIPKLRKSLPKTKFVHINSDAVSNFDRQQLFLSDYDFYFVKDPYIQEFMSNHLGLNAIYQPEHFNPRVIKKNILPKSEVETKVNIDVVMFGNIYPYRSQFIDYLLINDIDLKIFGILGSYVPVNVQKNFISEYIMGNRKTEIIYGSKVVVNNFHFAEIQGANQKFFEIFGAGGCQICTFKEIIKTYSPIDPELFTFKTRDEAVEKIRYYLANPDKRYDLSETMQKHFMENHTVDIRMKELLKLVFGH